MHLHMAAILTVPEAALKADLKEATQHKKKKQTNSGRAASKAVQHFFLWVPAPPALQLYQTEQICAPDCLGNAVQQSLLTKALRFANTFRKKSSVLFFCVGLHRFWGKHFVLLPALDVPKAD